MNPIEEKFKTDVMDLANQAVQVVGSQVDLGNTLGNATLASGVLLFFIVALSLGVIVLAIFIAGLAIKHVSRCKTKYTRMIYKMFAAYAIAVLFSIACSDIEMFYKTKRAEVESTFDQAACSETEAAKKEFLSSIEYYLGEIHITPYEKTLPIMPMSEAYFHTVNSITAFDVNSDTTYYLSCKMLTSDVYSTIETSPDRCSVKFQDVKLGIPEALIMLMPDDDYKQKMKDLIESYNEARRITEISYCSGEQTLEDHITLEFHPKTKLYATEDYTDKLVATEEGHNIKIKEDAAYILDSECKIVITCDLVKDLEKYEKELLIEENGAYYVPDFNTMQVYVLTGHGEVNNDVSVSNNITVNYMTLSL